MRATGFNHVSIRAIDLETSVRWYEELFGVERLPAPNFGINLAWLQLGDMQLHIFERDCESNRYSHFGLDVDDFEAIYLRAKALGAFDAQGYYNHHLFETPAGELQLYLRDPAANLLEVNWPVAAGFDRTVITDIVKRADLNAQSEENLRATIALARAEPARPNARPMPEPHVLSVVWQAKPGAAPAVAEFIRQITEASRKEPGVIAFHAAIDSEDPGRFHLFEIYRDRDAHAAHMETEHFKRFVLEGAVPLLDRRERTALRQLA